MPRRWLAALAAALIAGSAWSAEDRAATFRCSARGGRDWREYRSKHFFLDTDGSLLQADLLLKRLETMEAMVLQALLGEQAEIPGRVRVIAFSSPSDFSELSGSQRVAGYFITGQFGEPTIVLPFSGLDTEPEVVAHELAHHISWHLFPRQPRWFAEGLAYFVQTVAREEQIEPATGTHLVRGERNLSGGVGMMPRDFMAWLNVTRVAPMKDLLDWQGREDAAAPRYNLSSWLLYHWLWNNRSKQFSQYQSRLSDAADPMVAWQSAFPEFDPAKPGALAKLDEALEQYSHSARYAFYKVSARGDATFTDAPLSSADVHLYLLGARHEKPADSQAVAELDEALREDPAQPVAIAWRARLAGTSPLPTLRQAAPVHPRDWRVWLLIGQAITDADDKAEKEAALRKAVGLNPDSAAAQNALAWMLAKGKKAKEALPFANRAVDLAPWDPAAIDTLAAVAADLGQCEQAMVLQHRALEMLDPKLSSADAFRQRLGDYEGRCRKAESGKGTESPAAR